MCAGTVFLSGSSISVAMVADRATRGTRVNFPGGGVGVILIGTGCGGLRTWRVRLRGTPSGILIPEKGEE